MRTDPTEDFDATIVMGTMKAKYISALKYDRLTSWFDVVIRLTLPERQFRTALVAQARIEEGHRVLDFGVGTAALSLLVTQLAPKSRVIGVDVDDKILAIARKKIASAEAKIRVDLYDGVTLPYPDESFDRVVSSLVFHHLTRHQKEKALQEIRRVLRSGGELHVADMGKARTLALRVRFVVVQLLDGFDSTTDNVKGLLPTIIANAGFVDVRETTTFDTLFGTLALYQASRA